MELIGWLVIVTQIEGWFKVETSEEYQMTTDSTERFLSIQYHNMAAYYRPHSCRAICNTGHG